MQSCSVEGRAGRSTLNETSLSAEGSCLEMEEACLGVQCTLSWKSQDKALCAWRFHTHLPFYFDSPDSGVGWRGSQGHCWSRGHGNLGLSLVIVDGTSRLLHTLTRPSLGVLQFTSLCIYADTGGWGSMVGTLSDGLRLQQLFQTNHILVCGNLLPRGRGAKRPKRQMAPALCKSKTGLQQQRQVHLCTQSMKRCTC